MNEWLKKITARLKELWAKWTPLQKGILAGIVVVVIAAIIMLARFSAAPTTEPLFNMSVNDQAMRDSILVRLDQENVKYTVSQNNIISVPDAATARRMRAILIREDLVPSNMDPWSLFDTSSWTTTDFERNVNLQRSITKVVTQHIEALDEVSHANVIVTHPQQALFADDQEPVKASVILYFKQGSNMASDRKKIQGVQKILLRAVDGLKEENITISDSDGNLLNNFEDLADLDRINNIEKEQKIRAKQEKELTAAVLKSLQKIFSSDRIRDLNVSIEMDMSKVTSDKTIYSPVIITEQDPDKPYDTTEKRDYLPISSQTVTKEWQGTGYNPEGPAGVEGQNPPVYSDMSNVVGKSTETGVTQNNVVNTEYKHVEQSPTPGRRTVSVNIDGIWRTRYDKNHKPVITDDGHIERTYIPLTDEEKEMAAQYVRDAIGYNKSRGDSVTVTSLQIYREDQFEEEEARYFAERQRNTAIVLVLLGTILLLIAFIIFRFISREMERRRRLREEEILRRQQAEREKQLWDAKNEGMEVTMSVEERKRAELQENAVAMAKEHPEDVAMLLRTWLMEE